MRTLVLVVLALTIPLTGIHQLPAQDDSLNEDQLPTTGGATQRAEHAMRFRVPDHSGFDSLLIRHTLQGMVDYAGIKAESPLLTDYLEGLRDSSALYYEEWDAPTRMAFWINAYNAITIYAIISNYPIEYGGLVSRLRFPKSSIRQIKDVWDTPYFELAGRLRTLNEIEHDILRDEFGDPRIHFAIVCASKGCPLLAGRAYSGDSLEESLDRDARRFINNQAKVRVDRASNVLHVSSIFKWYADDFKTAANPDWLLGWDVRERGAVYFIARYIDDESREYIMTEQPTIDYLDYDWSLNELVRE